MASKCENICSTRLTIQWLEELLQDSFQTKSAIEDCTVKEIGEGKGFVSQILRVSFRWEPQAEGLPESVVLKVPGVKQFERLKEKKIMSEEMEREFENMMGNSSFLDKLLKIVSKLYLFMFSHVLP